MRLMTSEIYTDTFAEMSCATNLTTITKTEAWVLWGSRCIMGNEVPLLVLNNVSETQKN